jgi:hypothetical protein
VVTMGGRGDKEDGSRGPGGSEAEIGTGDGSLKRRLRPDGGADQQTRAQLLARTVRRASSLPDEVRATMLAGLATNEGTVQTMVALIDDLARLPPHGPPALTAAGPLNDDRRNA